jgi:RNA polymerase-binding transcription factor
MRTPRKLLRRRLERALSRTRARISEIHRQPAPQELESGGDNTPLSEDEDRTNEVEQKELDDMRLEQYVEREGEILNALKRMQEGTYGVCVSCGNRVDEERLSAIPDASLCIRCAEASEGPGEPGERATEPRLAGWGEADETLETARYEHERRPQPQPQPQPQPE